MAFFQKMNGGKSLIELLGRSASALKVVRQMQISSTDFNSDGEVDISKSEYVLPNFRKEWEDEYLEDSFQPLEIKVFCFLSSVYYLVHFFVVVFVYSEDGANGNRVWVVYTWLPELVSAVSAAIIFWVFSCRRFRRFCQVFYDWICAYTIILSYLAAITPTVLLEVRRSKFQRTGFAHIKWGIDYASFPPLRMCNDTDPVKSFSTLYWDASSIGCNNMILSGMVYSVYILHNLLPRIIRNNGQTAVFIAVFTAFVFVVALLSVGTFTRDLAVISAVAFQLLTGLGTSYFCYSRKLISREQFAASKSTKFAAEQNRNLLYTLIPENVVQRYSVHEGQEMLGNEIPWCSIMFCCLEPQTELQASSTGQEFGLLDKVFSDFDSAVKKFGMFKYQHVSDWYIVACPRAACPFDTEEQAKEYPASYTQRMVLLADELQAVARRFKSCTGAPLWLKVGLNSGPVAGAVIGLHRAFYCLYGDTVNTAARMCKYAGADSVHCTEAFAGAAGPACLDFAVVESRGQSDIKGKGIMETFELRVLEERFAAACESVLHKAPDPGVLTVQKRTSVFRRSLLFAPRAEPDAAPKQSVKARLSFSPMSNLHVADLTPEDRAWVEDPRHRIDHWRVVFRDPAFEAGFVSGMTLAHRQWLIAGLLLHMMVVALQWRLVVFPEYRYDFAALGSDSLARARNDVGIILGAHWAVAWVYCVGIAVAVHSDAQRARVCSHHFLAVKLVHLAVCVVATARFKAVWGWTMAYTLEMLFLNGWMGLLSFRSAVVLAGCALAVYLAAIAAIITLSPEEALRASGFALGVVFLSRASNFSQRVRWRLLRLHGAELRRMREILSNILPERVSTEMVRLSAKPPPEVCRAVVLQLDICKFTVLSQTLKPIEAAQLVHSLFSGFDAAVKARGLFKMDTVGDAYIVAGFLPATGEGNASPVCREILEVAWTMLNGLSRHRYKTGQDVRCRIGIAVGTVLCGVLGRLQPRFHVFGPGIRAAEKLEQTGTPDAVHASDGFVEALASDLDIGCTVRSTGAIRSGGHRLSIGNGVVGGAVNDLQGLVWTANHPSGWKIIGSLEHFDCIAPKKRNRPLALYSSNQPAASVSSQIQQSATETLHESTFENESDKVAQVSQRIFQAFREDDFVHPFDENRIVPDYDLGVNPDSPDLVPLVTARPDFVPLISTRPPMILGRSASEPDRPAISSRSTNVPSGHLWVDRFAGQNSLEGDGIKETHRRISAPDPLMESPTEIIQPRCWQSYVLSPDLPPNSNEAWPANELRESSSLIQSNGAVEEHIVTEIFQPVCGQVMTEIHNLTEVEEDMFSSFRYQK